MAYTGTISTDSDNPIEGRSAFVGESYGYVTTQLNLASLAGQSVRFGFRLGTDSAVDDYGWFIDDVRICQCVDVNDPPVLTVPSGQSVNEDTNLILIGLSVADSDAGSASVRITLSATQGVLTLNSLGGLTFTVGDGTADASMTFQGTLVNLNNALNGLIYRGNLNYNGSDTLTITADDLGNTGAGGAQSDSETVAITVNAVNDAPSFTKGADQTAAQDSGAQTAPSWGTAISVGPSNESAQIPSFVVINDKNFLFSVQPAIASNGALTFTPASGMRGTALVTVELHDTGGTANGGQDASAQQTFNITIGQSTDSDTDGLPNDWEVVYFGTTTTAVAEEDFDGDGFTNAQELAAGTNPTNPSSALGITDTQPVNNDVQVSFATVAGKTYRVERSDTSPAGPWSTVRNNIAGTGGVVQVLDAGGASQPKRFYRVVLLP
jgi:hypothetical protein